MACAGVRVVPIRIPSVLAPAPVTNAGFAATLSRILGRPRFLRVLGFLLDLAMDGVADAVLEGDATLRPDRLTSSGFHFLHPDLASALRHELSHP